MRPVIMADGVGPTVRAREELRRAPADPARTARGHRRDRRAGATLAARRRRLSAAGPGSPPSTTPTARPRRRRRTPAEVEAYLVGLRLDPGATGCTTAYYSGYRYESPAGRRLAELVQQQVPPPSASSTAGCRDVGAAPARRRRCRGASWSSDQPRWWSSGARARRLSTTAFTEWAAATGSDAPSSVASRRASPGRRRANPRGRDERDVGLVRVTIAQQNPRLRAIQQSTTSCTGCGRSWILSRVRVRHHRGLRGRDGRASSRVMGPGQRSLGGLEDAG